MKKLMIASALVAFCGAVMADAIESANTVGYQNQTWMPADFVMMGGQFETTAGTSIKLSKINFGAGFTGPEYGDGSSYVRTAPQVQLAFANSEGTTKYYFLSDGKWVGPGENDYGPGWVTAGGDEADPDVSIGLGFWYKDAYNATRALLNAGQVIEDAAWDKTFNTEYRMLVCPYPKAVKLSEITFDGINNGASEYGDGSSFVRTATQIQVPFATSEGFTKYYYLADGKWVGPGENDYGPGWVTAGGDEVDASTITIPAGRGCWFRPRPSGPSMTVTFTK